MYADHSAARNFKEAFRLRAIARSRFRLDALMHWKRWAVAACDLINCDIRCEDGGPLPI